MNESQPLSTGEVFDVEAYVGQVPDIAGDDDLEPAVVIEDPDAPDDAADHPEDPHPGDADAVVDDCDRPEAGTLGDVHLDAVSTTLEGLTAEVRRFHARAESYEQLVRQMQARIENLQRDQVQALLKPLIQRVVLVHAQAGEAAEAAVSRGEAAAKDLAFFVVALEEALGLIDVESVGAAPGVLFDPKQHHATRLVPTRDPAADRRVQRVQRQGFSYTDAPRVFLPAQVSVFQYDPALRIDEPAETNGTNPMIDLDEGARNE